jgi:hypothetical protein
MLGYSSISTTPPVSGPGTELRYKRAERGMCGLLNRGSVAAWSLAMKSRMRPGFTAYL